jgi:hypothetical protein
MNLCLPRICGRPYPENSRLALAGDAEVERQGEMEVENASTGEEVGRAAGSPHDLLRKGRGPEPECTSPMPQFPKKEQIQDFGLFT